MLFRSIAKDIDYDVFLQWGYIEEQIRSIMKLKGVEVTLAIRQHFGDKREKEILGTENLQNFIWFPGR